MTHEQNPEFWQTIAIYSKSEENRRPLPVRNDDGLSCFVPFEVLIQVPSWAVDKIKESDDDDVVLLTASPKE